jgi:hypothetical protein
LSYAADWQPQRLAIEGVTRGQIITMNATFTSATATIDLMQGSQKAPASNQVSPHSRPA